jgi:hypothetical protein
MKGTPSGVDATEAPGARAPATATTSHARIDALLRAIPPGLSPEVVRRDHIPVVLAEVAVVMAKDPTRAEQLVHAIAAWQVVCTGPEDLLAVYDATYGRRRHAAEAGHVVSEAPHGTTAHPDPEDDEAVDDTHLLTMLDEAIETTKKSKEAVALAEEHGGFDKIPVSFLGDLLEAARVWTICARLQAPESERQARQDIRRVFRRLSTACFTSLVKNERNAARLKRAQEELAREQSRMIRIDAGYPEHKAVDDALGFLQQDRDLYVQRSGNGDTLVVARPSATWRGLMVRPLSEPGVADRLPRFASVVAIDKSGVVKSAHVPKWLSQVLRDRGNYPGFRRLVAVATVPLLGPDGRIIGTGGPGWDQESGYLYAPDDDYFVPRGVSIPDVVAARDRILGYVSEFPWASPASRSAWFAGLLTTFTRPGILGPCPFFVVDGNLRGVGKTTLARIIGLVRTGRATPLLKWSKEEELQKSLLATLRGGPAIINIDNLRGYVESLTLEALFTNEEFRCRLLGTNTDAIIDPMHTVIFGTANNAILSPDLVRRAIPIRLETDSESPEKREFRRKDLDGDVRADRKQIVEDVLRCIVGYVEAGSRAMALAGGFGSFERWALVRHLCVWLGLGDPVVAREGWTSGAQDNDAESVAAVYAAIEMISNQTIADSSGTGSQVRGYATAALLHTLMANELTSAKQAADDGYAGLRDAIVEMSFQRDPGPRAIGRALRRIQAFPLAGKRLRARDDGHGTLRWWIESRVAGR